MTILPPKKTNAKKGVPQVGIFLRTAEGEVHEAVMDRASHDEEAFAVALIRGLSQLPSRTVFAVRCEVVRAIKPPASPKSLEPIAAIHAAPPPPRERTKKHKPRSK